MDGVGGVVSEGYEDAILGAQAHGISTRRSKHVVNVDFGVKSVLEIVAW